MKTTKFYWLAILNISLAGAIVLSCKDSDKDDPDGPSQNLIFHETFEGAEPFSTAHNKEVGDWDYALQFVGSPLYDGTRSARFEIRQDQPMVAGGKRAEVTVIFTTNEKLTKDAWYSFAVYFPSDGFVADNTHDVISQWYKDGSPVRVIARGDKLILDVGSEVGKKEEIDIAELTRDTWHELVFHFIHSPYSDGYIAIWHNGVQKVARSGGNMYNESLPKWKIGVYKSAYELGTSPTTNRVVLFDNVKVGDKNATYRDMEPKRP